MDELYNLLAANAEAGNTLEGVLSPEQVEAIELAIEESMLLQFLEEAGVGDWEGYQIAQDRFFSWADNTINS